MRSLVPCLLLFAAGCGADPGVRQDDNGGDAMPPTTPLRPASNGPAPAEGQWRLADVGLVFSDGPSGRETIRIGCTGGTLTVTLPAVAPIASEERLSFGGGGDIEVLVADPRESPVRGAGPAPDEARLKAMLAAGPGANYGASALGPLVPVPEALATALVGRCRG